MTDCPPMKDLEGLAAGTLSPDQASIISSHVGGCGECREALEDCRANLAYLAGARHVLVQSVDANGEVTRELTSSSVEVDSKSHAPIRPQISGYTVVRELHRGGQGIVYESIQESTKRKVAI